MKKRILYYLAIMILSTTSMLGCGDSAKPTASEPVKLEIPSAPIEATVETPESTVETNIIEETPAPEVVEATPEPVQSSEPEQVTTPTESSPFTFEDLDKIMYASTKVNIRSIPNTDGEKVGSLEQNAEVKVTGKCIETGWYRLEYNGSVAYVSNDFLANNKVEEKIPETTQTNTQSSSDGLKIIKKSGYSYINTVVSSYDEAVAAFKAVGIEPWVLHEENGTRWLYAIVCHATNPNKGNFESDFDTYICFNAWDWGNRLGTKDGRVYVDDAGGGSWSIDDCVERN